MVAGAGAAASPGQMGAGAADAEGASVRIRKLNQ